MDEIVITNAVGLCAKELSIDSSIIKGKSFYFGKIDEQLPEQNLRCNSILQYLADKLDLSKYNKSDIGIVIATTNAGIEEFITSSGYEHLEYIITQPSYGKRVKVNKPLLLDEVYEAKCFKYMQPGDLFWVIGGPVNVK